MDLQSYNYATQDEQQRYLELLVRQLQEGLGDYGFTITRATSANITVFTGMNFQPVLPEGTTWFDSTIKKLRFIATQAVPGVSNAVVETVTSV